MQIGAMRPGRGPAGAFGRLAQTCLQRVCSPQAFRGSKHAQSFSALGEMQLDSLQDHSCVASRAGAASGTVSGQASAGAGLTCGGSGSKLRAYM